MPRLCETTMSCRVTERYERHRFVERLMKNDMDVPRRYTWMGVGTYSVKIRCMTEQSEDWHPVIIPEPDSMIRFEMDAHLRVSHTPHENGQYGKLIRRTNTNYISNLEWIERKAGQIGIKLRSYDYEPIKAPIDYPNAPFVKDASRFRGNAIIVDPEKLLQALAFGIGDAKTFGFGFFNFRPIG